MTGGTPSALTVVRVARGQPRPAEVALRAAIERDRARLRLPADTHQWDLSVAGPYQISIDGQDLDEYVVWER
jgi:hypothetical protein